jgi:hypothetical protein
MKRDSIDEKAEQVIRKYYTFGINKEGQTLSWHECKQCALTEVNAIIEVLYSLKFGNALSEEIEYWEAVKQEITKNRIRWNKQQ